MALRDWEATGVEDPPSIYDNQASILLQKRQQPSPAAISLNYVHMQSNKTRE